MIIPVYNAEATIERTLASLISNSDYIYEIILVDDHSTDKTFKKVLKFSKFFKIKTFRNNGAQSPGVTRKVGLEHSNGKWVTFLDADDCLTPSSLRYVYENIQEYRDLVLLHTQTIYYEFGTFTPDTIGHMDDSCGGNFYKRDYLIKNSLYPHESLYMAEDQYFNEIIRDHIEYCDDRNTNTLIGRFDYPVYEVHHDKDDKRSFALGNFVDYVCKYHLLYKEFVVDYYKHNSKMLIHLVDNYVENFVFCFFAVQCLLISDDIEFDYYDNLKYFVRALDYFEDTFRLDRDYIISYFTEHPDIVYWLQQGAMESCGVELQPFLSFSSFVNGLNVVNK